MLDCFHLPAESVLLHCKENPWQETWKCKPALRPTTMKRSAVGIFLPFGLGNSFHTVVQVTGLCTKLTLFDATYHGTGLGGTMFLCVMASNTKIQSCKAIIPTLLLHHLYSLTGTKESSGTPVPNQDRLAAAVRGHVESQQPDLQLIGRLKETWSLPGDGLLNHNLEHVFASLQPVAVPLARDLLSVAGHMKHQCKCRRRIWPKPLQPWPLMHMEYRNLTAPSYFVPPTIPLKQADPWLSGTPPGRGRRCGTSSPGAA